MSDDFLASVDEAIAYQGDDRVVHFTDYLALKSAEESGANRFDSYFVGLNNALEGLETGEVVVISGHTKNGKTLFAESWIRSMAQKNPQAKALILSFEVKPRKILEKYIVTPDLDIYAPLALEAMNFEWLKKRCLEAKYKFNCRLVMIDHLHFLVDMNLQSNMSLNIGAFMRRLKKEIALDMNMAVILIAHQGQPREGQEASLNTIRDSSFVAQESDATIIVQRRKNFDVVELHDIREKYGDAAMYRAMPPPDASPTDYFSAGLATVKIAVSRRSGVFDWRKVFRKSGHFLEEVI
jgi:replicative DNA helicase